MNNSGRILEKKWNIRRFLATTCYNLFPSSHSLPSPSSSASEPLNLHLVDGLSKVLRQFAVIQRPQDGIDVRRDGVVQLHLKRLTLGEDTEDVVIL